MKPDFICIGAQKAGTSWLYYRLQEHPEFAMPPTKEIHYFDRSRAYPSPDTLAETKLHKRLRRIDYSKRALREVLRHLVARNVREVAWWFRYYFRDYSDTWYLKLFAHRPGLTGDITPSYSILSEADVAHMHAVAPTTKLIFVLRNPVDRAWSHYRFRERFGRPVTLDDFESFKSFIESPAQELRSNYLRTIDVYLRHFDARQLLIGFYDAVRDQPHSLLSEILKHIGATGLSGREQLQRVDNESKAFEIPERYRDYLEEKYRPDLEELARRYGGYSTRWLASTHRHAEPTNGATTLPPVVHP